MRLRSALSLLALAAFPLFVLALLAGAIWGVVALASGDHTVAPAVKFLVLPLVLAVYWAIKDLRNLPSGGTDGPELTRTEHPALWAEVDRLASIVETEAPRRIVLVPDVNAAVSEVGGEREMVVGLPLLVGMTVGQLRSVLAHELGHYAGGDTAASARTYRWNIALHRIRDNASGPMRWLLSAYVWCYARVSAAASRDLERAADAFSAAVAGPEVAASAMRRMVELDAAWGLLNDNYVSLFELAGARASLTDGLTQVLEANAPGLGAATDQYLAGEKRRGDDTHPPVRERIAALESTRSVGHPLDGGGRPARVLLDDGDAWLARAEGELMVQDLPLASWAEVVESSGAQAAAASAGEIMHHLASAGAVERRDLSSVLALLDRGEQQPFGSWFAPRAKGEELHATAHEVLSTLVEAALVGAGTARHTLQWNGPWQVVDSSGTPVDTEAVAQSALTSPDGSAQLRAWLAARDIDADSVPGDRVQLRPYLLAATTLMTGPWEGRRDGYVWSTGLLFLEPGPEATSRVPGAQSRVRQEERVGRTVAEGLDALRARPDAVWIDAGDVVAARVKGLVDPKVDLRLADGTVLELRGKVDSESFEDPHAALRMLFTGKLVDAAV